MEKIKLGIVKETKNPPDRRVPLSPDACLKVLQQFPNVEIFVQRSDLRCFTDEEYSKKGLTLVDSLADCDIIMGVKEVKINTFLEDKKYLFFAHVAKKQAYNRELLRAILEKKISLIDYEYLTDRKGMRVVAFGHWAGVVGAYNGLRAWGERSKKFKLQAAHELFDMKEMYEKMQHVQLEPLKILITGGGRVAHGAIQTLNQLKTQKVSVDDFLHKTFDCPVFCQIDPDSYVRHKAGNAFDLHHFFAHPSEYESTFLPFTKVTDIYIPCHFWHPESPVFMTKEDMQAEDFSIKVIADVSCDINLPIPSTLRASTIADPFYDYNRDSGLEEKAFSNEKNVTVVAVDNLPGELPRDSSEYFGNELINNVLPSLFGDDTEGIVHRATITENGSLTDRYKYLTDYVEGKE